jgi:recombination protein RecA
MALPAHLLERLPKGVHHAASGIFPAENALPLGLPLDEVLPDGGLPRGSVVELAVAGGPSGGTSVALAACRAAQQATLQHGGQPAWCAFVDPSRTLYAPGVEQAGVLLERLLVVQPSWEALSRVAVRLAESHAFSVVVVDTIGMPEHSSALSLGSWPRIVRRLSIAAQESSSLVVLVTDQQAKRPLPLPVSLRLELKRPKPSELQVRIAKDKRGRVSSPRSVAWTRSRSKPLKPSTRAG